MPCTGTEEECRRRCIIDPTSCGGGPPFFANSTDALAAEIKLVFKGAIGDVSFRDLAAHLLKHFRFAAKET